MNYKSIIGLLLLVNGLCGSGYADSKTDTLPAARLKPYGRYKLNGQKQLELVSSAVHFGLSFEGTACALYVSLRSQNEHNYLQYELDGVYQKRIRIEGSTTSPIIIKANGAGKHNLWIYKATEAHTGAIIISKIASTGVKTLSVPDAPLIEFIGNSITCGAAADASEYPCGTGVYHDQHNAYMAYGPRVARALGANFMLSSVSGIGIYRTWNMDGPSMPQVYEKTDFQINNTKLWKFSTYKPKIVSIALGTNDLSTGDGKTPRKPFDADEFVAKYVKFVSLVKSKYPKARIALLSSPMVKGTARTQLEDCLVKIKAKTDQAYPSAKPVATFFFEPMEGRGCSGHPSVEDHAIMAAKLLPFYKNLLK
jgi:hypothetical protein